MRHGFAIIPPEKNFRWRGAEISRLEAFSDAVFAFALTLLVVSLEVPKTFSELGRVMRGFIPFAICFAMLLQVWYDQVRFFRRYGLQDSYTVFLNSILLFTVLFYVYPLKFLFTLVTGQFSTAVGSTTVTVGDMISQSQVPYLMVIYGLGFAAVSAILGLMYLHAYRMRTALDLNQIETLDTKFNLIDHIALATIGLLSAIIALLLPPKLSGAAGWLYFLIGPYFMVAKSIMGKKTREATEASERHSATTARSEV